MDQNYNYNTPQEEEEGIDIMALVKGLWDGRKTIIIVTVSPGPHRPYYLKSKGKEKGTYIRVAGTTRPATPYKIKELEMEGAKISWDELVCVDYPVTEKAIKKLCQDMNR